MPVLVETTRQVEHELQTCACKFLELQAHIHVLSDNLQCIPWRLSHALRKILARCPVAPATNLPIHNHANGKEDNRCMHARIPCLT